jgi:hypothetical protein
MMAMSGAAVTFAWPVSVRVRFGASVASAGAVRGGDGKAGGEQVAVHGVKGSGIGKMCRVKTH